MNSIIVLVHKISYFALQAFTTSGHDCILFDEQKEAA